MNRILSVIKDDGPDACKRGAVALLLMILLPMNTAVAEPSSDAYPSQAFQAELAFAASNAPLAEKPVKKMWVAISGYSNTVDQTDDTPCITASGYNLCTDRSKNVVAANFLPLHTRVLIPSLFGDKVFYVEDRMNRRYPNRVDVYFGDGDGEAGRAEALRFGVRQAEIVILDN